MPAACQPAQPAAKPAEQWWGLLAGCVCALVAGGLGALTLSEHIIGWNLGIDELLFQERPGAAATASPGRMGPNASLSLMLGGIALAHLYRGSRQAIVRAQMTATFMAFLALVPVVGYLYGATQLYAIARYTGIAVNTGIALLVLSIGILAARPGTGPVAALMSDAPHGVMARRLIIPALVMPLLLGYVRLTGERLGWYDTGFGLSIMVVSVIVLLSITIWRTAVALARSDDARRQAQQHRDELLLSERAARERAERADRAKDEFIAALSHELRTPLNAVVGWMQMLQQGIVSDASRMKATEAVARNAGVLAHLIEDLLDTSRMTMGHLELSLAPVDLGAVVQTAVESVVPTAEAKHVTVTVAPGAAVPLVIGDARHLQQVVWNLLSNAIKFSCSGGTVIVQVSAVDGTLTVHVRDEGEGIDPQFLPYVFDRLRQGDSGSVGTRAGLGLGLYIAKQLIEQHGGTIRAESHGAGLGATFTIALPAAADDHANDEVARSRAAPMSMGDGQAV